MAFAADPSPCPYAMPQTVTIEELQPGMFVHLDLGWWAHPFALSSFLITSSEQIDAIRGLGLSRLRWSPEKSRSATPSVEPAKPFEPVEPAQPLAETASAPANAAATERPVDSAAPVATSASPAAVNAIALNRQPAAGLDRAPPHADRERAAHNATENGRSQLLQQQAARQLCEQQYGEAGQSWLAAQRVVPHAPEQAREITEAMTRALLDKLMVDPEICVRVLSDLGTERTAVHALNVAVISLLMGRVFGFNDEEMLDLGVGALLHDVGKLDLPIRVQQFDPQFKATELAAYREHVALGLLHGRRMGLSAGALMVLAQHHEMADGSGFPARLNLDRMAIAARIVALVNRYDKLCNPAQLALALTPHEALSQIFAQSRNQFDATMLNAFIRMMGVYPPGSLVQLTDDRYATVVSCNSSRPLKPRVLVCNTQVPMEQALLLNLDGQADVGIRRSLKPTQLPAAARDYLSPRQRMVYFFEPAPATAAPVSEAVAA